MENYWLFVTLAAVTIFSPGPGVVMTITNSLRQPLNEAFGGIVGISVGTVVVAAISATGAGVVLATSAMAYTILKFAGAAYLIYLGVKLWRAPVDAVESRFKDTGGFQKRFIQGVALQLTNPKAIVFFLSIFPQFIRPNGNFSGQFSLLVLTYGLLVIMIHSLYAVTARRARWLLTSPRGRRWVNRSGGATFVVFGVVLATTKR
jgi:threonine/homoserine/homoserine lactone efflux protein